MVRAALIVVVAGAFALWLVLGSAPPQTATRGGPAAPAEAVRAAPGTAAPGQPPAQPAEPGRYPAQKAFIDAARAFFDAAGELPEAEREARAAALREQIEGRERAGALLPQEALMLRLALLRVTIDDPAVLDHESRMLSDAYRDAQAARPPAPPDPRFEAYKAREAEIVREVMTLEEIPEGLTRNEHLRRRLRELRSEVYSGSAAPGPD